MPEVAFGVDKFHADIGLAVAPAAHRDNAAFRALRGDIVHQQQRLPHRHRRLEWKQGPVPVHRLRVRPDAELLATLELAVNR